MQKNRRDVVPLCLVFIPLGVCFSLKNVIKYQHSSYHCPSWLYLENLEPSSYIQNYLSSVNYIEELQKFVEDDNYK